MTTTVVVKANHGWPVDVRRVHPKTGEVLDHEPVRVARDTEQTFHVHSGVDLRIHEVQPDEDSKAA